MKIRLKTAHDTYLRAGDDGVINQTNIPGSWEVFEIEEVDTTPTPPPVPPTTPTPPTGPNDARDLKGDFLHLGESVGNFHSTLFYLSLSDEQRKELRNLAKTEGHNCLVFYIYNEKDGAWDNRPAKGFNGYKSHDQVIHCVNELRADGLEPVPFLFPDDAPDLHKGGPAKNDKHPSWDKITDWVKDLLPKLNLKFVLPCLEMNESFTPEDMVKLGVVIRNFTSPGTWIIYHFTSGRISASPPRENKGKPKDQWLVPDPYNHSMPNWTEAVVKEVGYPLALAMQYPKDDEGHTKTVIKESVERLQEGRKGGFRKGKSTFPIINGEVGKPSWPNSRIREINKWGFDRGIKGTIHSG